MEIITSLNNNKIVMYSKLNQKKFRDEMGMFLLENYKLIVEAVKRDEEIISVIIREGDMEKFPSIINKLEDKIIIVKDNVFSKISDTVSSQGIIAVVRKKEQTPINQMSGRVLVLDRIQDAGNMGTLMRSALGFGFKNLVLIDCVDIYNPKTIRSSGGSVFMLNYALTTEKELLFSLRNQKFAVFTADMEGENLYNIDNFDKDLMLIIGNEGQGVSGAISEASTSIISIPMKSELESLNASVSGSIIMSYISSKPVK